MSIELEWSKLDGALSESVVQLLNKQLASIARPSFIGPITITSFDFGTVGPSIDLVDVRDVYPEFLDDELIADAGGSIQRNEDNYGQAPQQAGQSRAAFGVGVPADPWHAPPSPVILETPPSASQSWPSLQLHLRLTHQSDLRLTMITSLIINYPSPSFLSLPIKLHLTSLFFTGEIVLAYEAESGKNRLHFCLLDDLDATQRPSATGESVAQPALAEKPPPVGTRVLPQLVIESEIGDADKHALKNVSRVERFIQDALRKLLEEELVFPNFHTIVFQ